MLAQVIGELLYRCIVREREYFEFGNLVAEAESLMEISFFVPPHVLMYDPLFTLPQQQIRKGEAFCITLVAWSRQIFY